MTTELNIPADLRLAALCGPVLMVDELQVWGVGKSGQAARVFTATTPSSHLTVAGDLEALHAFADRLKMRRSWFQTPKRPTDLPHYDLVEARRTKALKEGALFVPARLQARVRLILRGLAALVAQAPGPRARTGLLTRPELDANPWAACGQAAAAAVLRLELRSIRHVFPDHSWCNLPQMRSALTQLGVTWKNGPIGNWPPPRGLTMVEFLGPWSEPGVPPAAALKHTHWIAVATKPGGAMIFDINVAGANVNGGWVDEARWQRKVIPHLLKHIPWAYGTWRIRYVIEIPHDPSPTANLDQSNPSRSR